MTTDRSLNEDGKLSINGERVIAGACDEGTNEIFQYGDIYCIVRIDCLSCVFDHIFKQTF